MRGRGGVKERKEKKGMCWGKQGKRRGKREGGEGWRRGRSGRSGNEAGRGEEGEEGEGGGRLQEREKRKRGHKKVTREGDTL